MNLNNYLQKSTLPSIPKKRKWYFFDLEDKIIGRVAPIIVRLLSGKDAADFFPCLDTGNFVVLVNANKITFTGNKLKNKFFYNHSGYPGGLRKRSTKTMLESYPVELVERIVGGMMPHTKLGKKRLERLFIYPGIEHNKQAQEKDFININISSTK